MAIVVVAEHNLVVGGNVFLTDIADGIAQGYLIHAAVERIHGAIDSNRYQLEVVGRIDEEGGSVDIVIGSVISNTRSQGARDNHILGVNYSKRRRNLDAVFIKCAQRQTVDGIGD